MIIQGSNGIDLVLRIWENNKPANFSDSTAEIKIKSGIHEKVKAATIIENGIVSATLYEEDIPIAGIYYAQAIITSSDQKKYYSEISSFPIGNKL